MIRLLLASGPERTAYLGAVSASIGVRLPAEYLDRGEVTGLFIEERLVGGFTIVRRGPFRSLEQLPLAVRARLGRRMDLLPEVVEGNGLFLDPSVREPRTIAEFWGALDLALERSEASHMVFSYPASSARLRHFYRPLGAESLYVGWVNPLEGMSGPEVECVELAGIAQMRSVIRDPCWLSRRAQNRVVDGDEAAA